jgi:predicted esterase
VDEGGSIDLDDGTIVEGTFDARFALSVPLTTMPAEGYPIVLYSHGTGGDYRSFLEDGTADRLAQIGIAVMGIDQIHHGERNPTTNSPDILFFNITNPPAVRYNTLESAVDVVSQARFAAAMDIPLAILDRDGAQVRLDASRMYFFGHSQGGLVAPLYLAIDDATHGGVISEGGGLIGYALTLKTEPINIPVIVAGALGIRDIASEDLTLFHPVISLVQGWIEPSEPTNYAPMLFSHPRAGYAAKSIFMTEGGMDPYTPPPAIEALAVAMGTPQVDPISHRIPNEDFLGIAPAGPTVTGNVAGGTATAGLLQFANEGHFAVFDNADCKARYVGFFTSLIAAPGPGTIPPPP